MADELMQRRQENMAYYLISQQREVIKANLDTAVREKDEKQAEYLARSYRDKLLSETDWYMTVDRAESMDADTLAKYKTYRQALRDVPEQDGFPLNIEWPVAPDVEA